MPTWQEGKYNKPPARAVGCSNMEQFKHNGAQSFSILGDDRFWKEGTK